MIFIEIKKTLLGITLVLAVYAFEAAEAADITTVDGRVYRNVKFDMVSKRGLTFMHSSGIVTLTPDMLTSDDRNKYSTQIAKYEAFKAKQEAKIQAVKNRQRSAIAKKAIEAAVKMYADSNPEAFDRMEKAIRDYDGTPEAENGKKLLAEWKKARLNQVIVHHQTAQCRVYLFKYSAELETLLKNIAEIHWKVNDMNTGYMGAKVQAENAYRMGNPNFAKDALNRAKMILQKSQEARNSNNQMFEKLISQGYVIYNTIYNDPGMWLKGVTDEYLFFFVEVVENGAYVRAWCCRAKGGSSLTIKGRNIECSYEAQTQLQANSGHTGKNAAASSGSGGSPEHFDLVWMLKNNGYLNNTPAQLSSQGFKYIAQHNIYRKEPFPPATLMNCFIENGHVKRSIINLSSYSDSQSAADRFAEYTANFERQLQGRKAKWKIFSTKSSTNNKLIKIYDLTDCHFMVAVYRMELPVINKHIIFVAAFSKKFYNNFDSIVNELKS